MIINRLQPIVRWTLAIILMFAGAAKLVQTDAFARTLADTGFLTTAEAAVTAVARPAAEVILALLLVTATIQVPTSRLVRGPVSTVTIAG